jgi:hypothetical protein
MSRIISFRGKLANGAQDTIPLQTNNGLIGYRIVKFEAMAIDPEEDVESTMKVYSIEQTTVTNTIDFSDNTLLAAMIYNDSASNAYGPQPIVVFDNIIFNQDIYITLKAGTATTPFLNYHIELEQKDLALDEATVSTLKDIRNTGAQ